MIKIVVLSIVSISIFIALYDVIDLYKSYDFSKPNFLPLALQVVLGLLIISVVVNLLWFLFTS